MKATKMDIAANKINDNRVCRKDLDNKPKVSTASMWEFQVGNDKYSLTVTITSYSLNYKSPDF